MTKLEQAWAGQSDITAFISKVKSRPASTVSQTAATTSTSTTSISTENREKTDASVPRVVVSEPDFDTVTCRVGCKLLVESGVSYS